MLHRLIALIGFIFLVAISFAQEPIHEKAVPEEIRNDFQYRFVDAENVVWLKQGEDFYGARFIFEKSKHEAIYNHQGLWIQTDEDINYEDLPDDAQDYCRANFAGAKIKEVKQISTRNYGILFDLKIGMDLQNYLLTFDQNGKLKEEQELAPEVVEESQGRKKINIGGLLKRKSE